MGRAAFTRFLGDGGGSVRAGDESATWDEVAASGSGRSVEPGRAYAVDPAAGLASFAALFAVARVPDTTLLWASPDALGVAHRPVGPALSEVEPPVPAEGRPLWGVCTSGSSGAPKVAIGHADLWELVALHYRAAVYDPLFRPGARPVLATCLPLGFSAAFFMTVLPALFFRADLIVHPADDWSAVTALGAERDLVVLGVPAVAAAACLGMAKPADMSKAVLILGGGHIGPERLALIRGRFTGARVANIYGTAETGAMAVDPSPGHNAHVGAPIPGKAVWIQDPDERGVGVVAAAGPDCCRYVWRPGQAAVPTPGHVTGTDYGLLDAEGNLRLEGRVDGGEKVRGALVYPRAIERHLLALPGVSDARVVVERPSAGLEHLVARVVGRVGDDEVRAHCATLPEAQRPTRVDCIPEERALSAYSANGKL